MLEVEDIENLLSPIHKMERPLSNNVIIPLIDYTLLSEKSSAEEHQKFCQKALSLPVYPAAVCVYPEYVSVVKKYLQDSPIKIASVANFPSGTEILEKVIVEMKEACSHGAVEIDLVFPYAAYLQGLESKSLSFVEKCKSILPSKVKLKVIIETGAFSSLDIVAKVTEELIEAGADFIKTSTGKISQGATLESAYAILTSIAKSKKEIGFKASGGITKPLEASQYIELAKIIMGDEYITPKTFRIGASRLIDHLHFTH